MHADLLSSYLQCFWGMRPTLLGQCLLWATGYLHYRRVATGKCHRVESGNVNQTWHNRACLKVEAWFSNLQLRRTYRVEHSRTCRIVTQATWGWYVSAVTSAARDCSSDSTLAASSEWSGKRVPCQTHLSPLYLSHSKLQSIRISIYLQRGATDRSHTRGISWLCPHLGIYPWMPMWHAA